MAKLIFLPAAALIGLTALAAGPSAANDNERATHHKPPQPITCAQLATDPAAGLLGAQGVKAVTSVVVAATGANASFCQVDVLYGASPGQTLLYLRLPTALPYFLAGLRISGGLALIGAVVAEFVAGTGGAETGLAFRILEAGYRLAIPRLFAALFLLSLTGIVIYLLLDWLSRRVLRHWHESAAAAEEE